MLWKLHSILENTSRMLYACYWCSTGALRPSKTKRHRRPPVFTAHFNHQCFLSFLHWLLFTIIQHTSPYVIALHFWVLHFYIQVVLFSYLWIKYSDSDINLPSIYPYTHHECQGITVHLVNTIAAQLTHLIALEMYIMQRIVYHKSCRFSWDFLLYIQHSTITW